MAGHAARRERFFDFVNLPRRKGEFGARRHAGEHLFEEGVRSPGRQHVHTLARKRKKTLDRRRKDAGIQSNHHSLVSNSRDPPNAQPAQYMIDAFVPRRFHPEQNAPAFVELVPSGYGYSAAHIGVLSNRVIAATL